MKYQITETQKKVYTVEAASEKDAANMNLVGLEHEEPEVEYAIKELPETNYDLDRITQMAAELQAEIDKAKAEAKAQMMKVRSMWADKWAKIQKYITEEIVPILKSETTDYHHHLMMSKGLVLYEEEVNLSRFWKIKRGKSLTEDNYTKLPFSECSYCCLSDHIKVEDDSMGDYQGVMIYIVKNWDTILPTLKYNLYERIKATKLKTLHDAFNLKQKYE